MYETPTLIGHNVVLRETIRSLFNDSSVSAYVKEIVQSEPMKNWSSPGYDSRYLHVSNKKQDGLRDASTINMQSAPSSSESVTIIDPVDEKDYSVIEDIIRRDGVHGPLLDKNRMLGGDTVKALAYNLGNGNQNLWRSNVKPFIQRIFPGDDPEPFDYNKGISQYAYLGAQGPDFPYYVTEEGKLIASDESRIWHVIKTRDYIDWFQPTGLSLWADLAHYCKSGVYVITLIDIARSQSMGLRNKIMSYTLGHICHIATDAVLHPFVNSLAGAYYNLSIDSKKVMKRKPDIVSSTEGFNIPIDLHHLVEFHMDTWLAQNYFGRINITHGEEWADYVKGCKDHGIEEVLQAICRGYTTNYGYSEQEKCCHELYDGYLELYKLIYGLSMKYPELPRPIPQHPENPNTIFIEPGGVEKVYPEKYVQLLKKATSLASSMCKSSVLYYVGAISRKEAKRSLGCFNLDTGYNILVKEKRRGAVLEFQHSWIKKVSDNFL